MDDVRAGNGGLGTERDAPLDPRVAALIQEFDRHRTDRDADLEVYLKDLAELRDQIAHEDPTKEESIAALDEVLRRFDKGLGTKL